MYTSVKPPHNQDIEPSFHSMKFPNPLCDRFSLTSWLSAIMDSFGMVLKMELYGMYSFRIWLLLLRYRF